MNFTESLKDEENSNQSDLKFMHAFIECAKEA